MICPVCDESNFLGGYPLGGRMASRCAGCGCMAFPPRGAVPPAPPVAIAARHLESLARRGYREGSLLTTLSGPDNVSHQAAVLLEQLHACPTPGESLDRVRAALQPGAPLLITVPAGRVARRDALWSFDRSTIQLLLLRHGFHQVLARSSRSALTATAIRAPGAARPKCSIIVAAYNERRTFPVLMDALLNKRIAGVEREILVVASPSADGTHELARQYGAHPDVRVILQDRARGKGRAIRDAFRHVTGDIILIQDADLEYDLNDYDALLAPLLSHRALFVLGTRHSGSWKMRRFSEQKGLADALNFGHAFFTGLINLLYGQQMTDPFTMFKVLRSDCLFGLTFECNRFDFDHELVIKLVKKGYRPLEVPVNYCSRSFREGKKVRLFRDPLTWLWVDLKLRFTRAQRRDSG